MSDPEQLRAIIAAVERAADVALVECEFADEGLLRECATLLRRIGPADGEPSPAVDGWLDERAERMFWEFDAQRKQTGAERDAFKAVVRQALRNERFAGKMMFRFGQADAKS